MKIATKSDEVFVKRAKDLVEKLTIDEKLLLLTTHHHAVERLGMGEFYIGTEVARGYVGRSKEKISTVFPQPEGLASTFDREIMYKLGEIAGDEARAYYNEEKRGGLCLWGPTVDMVRDPRWGRAEEAYGEDVFLAGELTASYTKGMAGDNGTHYKTIPTLKHFCANNNEEKRGSCNAYLPLRLKYEYYYAAFENAIRFGGAKSIMAAYNEINGVPAILNPELQTILKDMWGLWFVVSDGGDFSQTVVSHRYVDTHSESLSLSLKAGADTMTDNDMLVERAGRKALDKGILTEEEIDRTLENVLFARFKLGQFDEDCEFDKITKDVIDCEEYREANLRATREQIVLLKNNGLLPIKNKPSKVAVVGALADEILMDWYTGYSSYDVSVLDGIKKECVDSEITYDSLWDIVAVKAPNGKYFSAKENGEVIADADEISDSELFELQKWGENWNNFFSVKYKRYVRLFDGDEIKLHNRKIYDWFTRETFNFTEHFGKTVVEEFLHHRRLTCDEKGVLSVDKSRRVKDSFLFEIKTISKGEDRAVKLSKENDLVIYCVGNHPVQVAKECYDRKTLALNIQENMAVTLAENNKNTVMVVISSYPYSICNENEKVPAIIYTTHAGQHLGTAVSEAVFGKLNPAGRLPLTWYKSENDLPDIMEYDIEKGETTYMYFKGEPLYPFGYGLSYTEFEYSDFKVEKTADGISGKVNVKNTGETDGDEVVEIYYTVKNSAVTRPDVKLCGFERVFIKAGETKEVLVKIPEHILRFFDVRTKTMQIENGEYTFYVGASCKDLRGEYALFIDGYTVKNRSDSFDADSYEACDNVKILFSKNLERNYIRCLGWGGNVTYGGVSVRDKNKLVVTAQSTVKQANMDIFFDDEKVSVSINPSDALDDFYEYEIDIPQNTADVCTVKIRLEGDCAMLDLKLI